MRLYSLNVFRSDSCRHENRFQPAQWASRPVANLVRSVPSGMYFARAWVGGKLIRRSLQTNVLIISRSVAVRSCYQFRNSQFEIRNGKWRKCRALNPPPFGLPVVPPGVPKTPLAQRPGPNDAKKLCFFARPGPVMAGARWPQPRTRKERKQWKHPLPGSCRMRCSA